MTIGIIYLTINLLLRLLFKPDRSMMMCGISGASLFKDLSKNDAIVATRKLITLGLFNQSRGEHGCGLFINGQIIKGYQDISNKVDTRKFSNLISDPEFVFPTIVPEISTVAFIHSRHATSGAHTKENNHPFLIKSENEGNNIIGVHNGSISNIWALFNKNNISHTDIHVDSIGIYTLIDKLGLPILNEYKGYATLLYNVANDPDALYIYHGASKDTKDGKEIEERPLFAMDTAQGTFFSSLEEALWAIRDNEKEEPWIVEHNHIYCYKNGEITDFEHKVERGDSNVKEVYVYQNNFQGAQTQGKATQTLIGFRNSDYYDDFEETGRYTNQNMLPPPRLHIPEKKKEKESLVWRESFPNRCIHNIDDNTIYFHYSRYFLPDNKLAHGPIWIHGRGRISEEKAIGAILHWFYKGVMLLYEDSYKQIEKCETDKFHWNNSEHRNFALEISKVSVHPTTNLPNESKGVNDDRRFRWYKNGSSFTDNVHVKFSSRMYRISDGFLKDISASDKRDKYTIDINSVVTHTTKSETNCFDTIFVSIDEAMRTISMHEMSAIKQMINEIVTSENTPFQATVEEIEAEAGNTIIKAVKDKVSIRECLNDDKNLLEMFLELAETRGESITETYKDENVDEETQKDEVDNSNSEFLQEFTEIIPETNEMDEARNKLEEILDNFVELEGMCNDAHSIDIPFANDYVNIIFKIMTNAKHQLMEICEKHNESGILEVIQRKLN